MASPAPFAEAEDDEAPRTRAPSEAPAPASAFASPPHDAISNASEGDPEVSEPPPTQSPFPIDDSAQPRPTPAPLPAPASAPKFASTSGFSSPRGSHARDDRVKAISGRCLEYLGELGAGGMGRVDRYYDPILDRELAVKVLRDDSEGSARRFRWESQICGQLQHPGIVPIYEAGDFEDGRPFLAMKLVKGQTLHELLKARAEPANDLTRFLNIFEQICQAVAYAHSRRVIHRDLKPANVMVGAFGEVQVMDWGLAKVLDSAASGETAAGSEPPGTVVRTNRHSEGSDAGVFMTTPDAMGTPAYMPPEQARGEIERLNPRSDVFALGSILCEILTGKPAFAARSSGEAIAQSQRGDLSGVFARLDACGADAQLIALARECLAPEQDDRPENAQAVANRMASYFEGVRERLKQVELTRAQAEARAQSERRARRMTVMAAALLLAVALGAGAAWLYRDRMRSATERAVGAALQEAELLHRQAKEASLDDLSEWRLALNAVQRARDALETGVPAPDLPELVRSAAERIERDKSQAEADRAFMQRLEATQSRSFDALETERGQKEYQQVFRESGWTAESMTPEQVKAWAAQRNRRTLEELTFYVDDWASYLKQLPADDANRKNREWLLAILRELDPDPMRTRIRQLNEKGDKEELVSLARNAGFRTERSSRDLILLGLSILQTNDPKLAKSVLEEAWRREPGNYWVCLGLAVAEWDGHQFESAERASRFAHMALAIRPNSQGSRALCGLILNAQEEYADAVSLLSDAAKAHSNHAYIHLALGVAYRGLGKWDLAVEEFRKTIEINPNAYAGHNNLGMVYDDLKEYDKAILSYRQAIALEPKSSAAHSNLGLTLTNQAKYEEAIVALRQAVEFDPKNAIAFSNLGYALAESGKYDEAMTALQQSIKLDPENAVAYNNAGYALMNQRKYDQAIPYFRQALDHDGEYALSLRNLGHSLNMQAKYEEAIPYLRKAIAIDPNYDVAYNDLGHALNMRERYEEAIPFLLKAVAIDPKYGIAYNNLGYAFNAQRKFKEAIPYLRKAIECSPKNELALGNLGYALNMMGEFEEAIPHWRKAVELDPEYYIAHNNLAWALNSLRRYPEAEAASLKSIALNDQYGMAHHNLGMASFGQGKFDQAVAEYRKAIALDPKNAPSYNNLGFTLISQSRYEEAVPPLREAIKLDPKNGFAYTNLGRALLEQGEIDAAVPLLRKAIEMAPELAPPHGHLANSLLRIGKIEEAIAECRKAIAKDPKYAFAHVHLGNALQARGQNAESIREWREAQTLGEKTPGWDAKRVDALIADGERRQKLSARLPDVLKGGKVEASETLDFATMSMAAQHFAKAVELYDQAFAANAETANDLAAGHRGQAARAAVLAASGRGADDPKPDEAAKTKSRDQALRWLKADLEAWKAKLASNRVEDRRAAAQALRIWRIHQDWEETRDPKLRESLPKAERESWKEVWEEIDKASAMSGEKIGERGAGGGDCK